MRDLKEVWARVRGGKSDEKHRETSHQCLTQYDRIANTGLGSTFKFEYLIILVGSDSGELSAREDEGLPGVPVEAVDVV